MTTRDVFLFLRALASNPRTVGAIAPSSPSLANLITSEITAASGPILELGPGTGIFTEALLERGVKESDLTLIEYGSDFMRLLQLRFPRARVLWMDASWIISHDLFRDQPFGAVISGLPLLNMSPKKVMAILTGTFSNLRAGGAFYQFTYGMQCPISKSHLNRLGLKATCIGRVFLNVPPASVYRITRRKPCKLAQL
ncbi:phosphatidylethanolamine/phosphatidyl-N-methylethanolamine N-methyltransferase [Nitrobacteraceae bacterium AZCC 1564]